MMRLPFNLASIGIVVAMVSGASCGGSDGGGGTCAMANACGGDIVGNWKVTSSCVKVSGNIGDPDCPTATADATFQATGTASYTAALTYSLALTLTGTETVHLPATCLIQGGVTFTCDQLNQIFAANPPDPTITSIHCASAGGGGCSCTAQLQPMDDNESGTYTTAAGILTTTQSGNPPDSGGYCVKGTELDLTLPPGMDPGVMGSGSLTLTRQ